MRARTLATVLLGLVATTATQSCNSNDDLDVDQARAAATPSSGVIPTPNHEPVLPDGFIGEAAASLALSAEEAAALEATMALIKQRASGDPASLGFAQADPLPESSNAP
jgi:hypothetical protein